jgi:glycosyltransferase involved in cell wall biosynthesis
VNTPARHRILYYYGSQQFDTGSPKALVSLIDLLDRSVFDPLFIATGEGLLVDELRNRAVEIVTANVSNVSLKKPVQMMRRVSRWAKAIRDLDVDLLHLNYFGSDLDLVLGAWWARVPIILHLHNPETISFTNLHRFAATTVLLVSDAQKQDIAGFERIQRKSEVLYNSIDLHTFQPGTTRRDRASGEIVVATVGQISHRKGMDIVLETARILLPRHDRLVFWIVGRAGVGEGDYAQRVAEMAAGPVFGGRVKFLGSRSDIPSILRDADVFLFPTRSEPFGIALIEAMASGLPVIATRTGGVNEILSAPEYGVGVEAGSPPSAYAEAIERILEMPDLGRAMGQTARSSLLGRFDTATTAARLDRIYRNALDRDSAGSRRSGAWNDTHV